MVVVELSEKEAHLTQKALKLFGRKHSRFYPAKAIEIYTSRKKVNRAIQKYKTKTSKQNSEFRSRIIIALSAPIYNEKFISYILSDMETFIREFKNWLNPLGFSNEKAIFNRRIRQSQVDYLVQTFIDIWYEGWSI